MSDHVETPPAYSATEDKPLPMVAYVLYLLGHVTFVTIFIALVMAYANRNNSGPVGGSHYTFLIRTFWLSIGWWLIGGLLTSVGFVLSFVLVGIPILGLGLLIMGAIWIWAVVRCCLGLVYLAQDEPYPRPQSWLF